MQKIITAEVPHRGGEFGRKIGNTSQTEKSGVMLHLCGKVKKFAADAQWPVR